MTERPGWMFFHVQYCVNIFFFSNKARSVFISWNVTWVCVFLLCMQCCLFSLPETVHTSSEEMKTKNLTENYFDTSVNAFFLCALHTHTMAGGKSWQLGPVEMSAYFISRSCCIYRRTFFLFSEAAISWTVREREREREREGALYPASRSMCSTFSGLYSSAVIQSVIFKKIKKGLFIESLLRCSYSVLRCLNHVFTAELVQ